MLENTCLARAVLIIAAATAIFAGCGEEADKPEQTRSLAAIDEAGLPLTINSLTRAEHIIRVDEFCRGSIADMRKDLVIYRRKQFGPKVSDRRVFAYASKNSLFPHLQFWFDDISWMGAPEGDKRVLEDMLETLQLAVLDGQAKRVTNARQLASFFDDYNRKALQYGLSDCLAYPRAFELGRAGA